MQFILRKFPVRRTRLFNKPCNDSMSLAINQAKSSQTIPSCCMDSADILFSERQFMQNHCSIYLFENVQFLILFITTQRHSKACSWKTYDLDII